MNYITLTARKKCIGQYNFDPLLYLNENDEERHSFYLSEPGTYTIKYVSGAILSFGIPQLNRLIAPDKQLSENRFYWNKYTESSAVILGNYDISYFPTSSILLGCFQCQFGTLPGFTDTGYESKKLAEIMNSKYLSNINDKYIFSDTLKFMIQEPTTLIFWYTDINEQSVDGKITYSIDYVAESDQLYYLNDLSLFSIDLNTYDKLSYKNYSFNKNKENFIYTNELTQNIWLKNIKYYKTIKSITEFNTIGYSSAYINNIRYSDTLNYNKKYSELYHWELVKSFKSDYNFMGIFDNTSPDLLLYKGIYTIFLTALHNNYIFSSDTLNTKYIRNINNKELLDYQLLQSKTIYTFVVDTFGIIKFNKLLLDFNSVFLYLGEIDIDELQTYITSTQKNISFITTNAEKNIKTLYTVEPHKTINLYNNITYNFYIDISLYLEENILTFFIYSADIQKNSVSIGPFYTKKEAIQQLSIIFKIDTSQYTIEEEEIQTNNNMLLYKITYIKNE